MDDQIVTMAEKDEVKSAVKANILVVDDRPDGLLALEVVLSGHGYNLFKANSGQEALQYALFNDFAVILLDVQMPDLDGFETARLLRENPRSHDTPIIFVTAINTEVRHINQGYQTGAIDYIFKPFDPFVLQSKINIFTDIYNKNQQIKQQAATLRQLEAQEKERQLLELKRESYRSYTHLADAVPHCIIKVRFSGQIEYFNRQWQEYTGFQAEINWDLLIHPQDKRKFLLLYLRMKREPLQTLEQELRLRNTKDGIYRWHLVRVIPEIKSSETIGWLVSCTDIDNIKKAEDSFKVLSQELNRSNKELEEYAYVASHDLKEPLHVVSSFVYLLEKRLDTKLEGHEKQYVKFIKEGVEQALRLIKDLLEYSRIGKEKSLEILDVASVLKEVMGNLKTLIESSGATIHWEAMPVIKANYVEMIQLFQNLIVNAIKYRSQRKLEIHITSRLENDMRIFSIQDNGIGIDPQFKDRIFDKFQRLHAKEEYSGNGIGLAICKKIVENHGGRIWIDASRRDGTTFYFTIRQNL